MKLTTIILFSFIGATFHLDYIRQITSLESAKTESRPNLDSFLVTPTQVGIIRKDMTMSEAINLLPEDQVIKTRGYGEFPDDIYDDYEFYDSLGNHLFTLTPEYVDDLNQKINRVLIVDYRFQTASGIGLNSTYQDLIASYNVTKYSPDMDHITLAVGELSAWFSIDKDYLSEGWWDDKEKRINPDKIPGRAMLDSFVIWWN